MTMAEALDHALATGTPLLIKQHNAELAVSVPSKGETLITYVGGMYGFAWDDNWFNFEHDPSYTLLDWFDAEKLEGFHNCHCERHDLMIRGCTCGGK